MTKFHENVTLLNVEIKKEKKKLQLLLYITRILYVIHKTDDNFKFTIETERERHYYKKNTQQTDQISKKPRKN